MAISGTWYVVLQPFATGEYRVVTGDPQYPGYKTPTMLTKYLIRIFMTIL
jgi:hypothetical protein